MQISFLRFFHPNEYRITYDDKSEVTSTVQQFQGRRNLPVCETIEGQMRIFCDGIWVVDSVHSFRHKDGLLLEGHGLGVFPHDVVETGQHPQALCDFRMHGTVHIVEKVQRFTDLQTKNVNT